MNGTYEVTFTTLNAPPIKLRVSAANPSNAAKVARDLLASIARQAPTTVTSCRT